MTLTAGTDASEEKRDYTLTGESARQAVERGLVSAQWYHTDVDRKALRELMERKDGPAIRDTLLWLGLMMLFAGIGIWLWPSWWSAPFWLAYGVLYGSAGDSRWHECGHGTAFKTKWMNRWTYQIACFCMIRNPIGWRWSHSRHHSDTIIVGRDPEINIMQPPDLVVAALNMVGVLDAWTGIKTMFINAAGRTAGDQSLYVPEPEQKTMFTIARWWVAIYAATIALAVTIGSILPLMVIGLPRLYGAWHHVLTGILQHAGLAENVLDHRLNTRTFYANPISRFIYWNMNYHVEHHMFPMVPYHALPKLHALIKHDLPEPNTGFVDAFGDVWQVLKRQMAGEDYWQKRELPNGAKPYRDEFHGDVALA
ncbi:fatty acid desaturase family protein [Ahrensia sp. R2A130]|uniref:fatty acid desaturase family protein n=1 Tax=Ahrensia sp. R2A130 TaxID=744979 RepID=UPI0001E09426|nr:fatty acid desaturase family protein [Ahrensia sp. R2A130]EFL90583.1 putative hydrocarbon oxygenase protein [Ahrensia sp. R2A130]